MMGFQVFDEGGGLPLGKRTVGGSLMNHDGYLEPRHLRRRKRAWVVGDHRINVPGAGTQKQREAAAVAETNHPEPIEPNKRLLTLRPDKRLLAQIIDTDTYVDKC